MTKGRAVHGHRRGLAPLGKRLTPNQRVVRQEHIDWRLEQKALAKIIQRREARKGIKP